MKELRGSNFFDEDDWDAGHWEEYWLEPEEDSQPVADLDFFDDQMQGELDAWASGAYDSPYPIDDFEHALEEERQTADPDLVDAIDAWKAALNRPLGAAAEAHKFDNWKRAESVATLLAIARETGDLWPITKASRLVRKVHRRPRIALDMCVTALTRTPDNEALLESALRCSLGGCWGDLRDWDRAQVEASRASQLAPRNFRPYNLLARIARCKGEVGLAERLHRTAQLLGAPPRA